MSTAIYSIVGLVLGLFSLVVIGGLTIVVAVRAQGRPRKLGVAGFGLLTFNHLVQLIAPTLIGVLVESSGGGVLGNGGISLFYLVPTVIGLVLGSVAMVLLAMAVIGVRAASGSATLSAPLR